MGQQVVAGEQDPRARSQKTVSEGLCPGRCMTSSVRSRSVSVSPSRSSRVTWPLEPKARNAAPTAPQRGRQVGRARRGGASAARRTRRRPAALSREVARGRAPSRSSAATSAPERRDEDLEQPEVVHVLVGDHDQLEVLDRPAVRGQRLLELVERLARVRAGVDQRQRVVLDQVAVDPPDQERRRDGEAVDAGPRRRARARQRPRAGPDPSGSRRLLTSGSSRAPRRAGAPCPRGAQRLEAQPQQRLGVRRAHVEVPVVVVDRDAVQLGTARASA